MAATRVRSKVTLGGELAFPSDYLAAVEFKGRDVTLTITSVSKEPLKMMDGSTKHKMLLRFKGTEKKLVCNKTNADSIAQLYGTKAEEWVGKRVTLYPTRCLAFGDMVDCVRVRETVPPETVKSPTAAQALPGENGQSEENGATSGVIEADTITNDLIDRLHDAVTEMELAAIERDAGINREVIGRARSERIKAVLAECRQRLMEKMPARSKK